jgi:hypothetical protein
VRFFAVLVACSGVLACAPKNVYSVWLIPSGAQYDSLHAVICGLSARYPSHCFMPHVTVVGDVQATLEDIAHRVAQLARRTHALDARLTTIEWTRDNYYRSFYVLIDETPEFTKLYDDTCAVIGKCQTRPYHMSLMYTSTLSDMVKARIRDSLSAAGRGQIIGGRVRLTRLVVCSTAGLPPEQWTCPKEVRLE